ncbi:unnamed protein product [Rotaria socialis]|uniref:Uncharacterized protein n=1 Tax=Rotaria socialis TaxID=392032 RepID=A0A820YT09_9BILA|nr:unnamed protein product [Rotaria socialis]
MRNKILNLPTARQSQVSISAATADIDNDQTDEPQNEPITTTATTTIQDRNNKEHTHMHQVYDNTFKDTPAADVKLIVGNKNRRSAKTELICKRPKQSLLINKPFEIKQQDLSKQTLINIHLFNSQPCESLFRDARSLSSTFSTLANFAVKDFIGRSQKISILNQLKHNQSEKDLSVPIPHKYKREYSLISSHRLDEIDTLDIEQVILNVILNKNSRMINYSFPTENNTAEEFGLYEENDDNDVVNYAAGQPIDEILFDFQQDVVSSDDYDILNSTKSDFNGINIVDKINPALTQSYFKTKINGNIKYLHAQPACWLQPNQITKLSSDRLSRVMQQISDTN